MTSARSAAAAFALFFVLPVVAAADAPPAFSLQEADIQLGVIQRLIDGASYGQAEARAASLLSALPEASPADDTAQEWMRRREAARFLLERALFGKANDTDSFLDSANGFLQLSRNRYRLDSPAYAIVSAYWAGRAYQAAGDFNHAIELYGRVGGADLPADMEGDAARRVSQCLRELADVIPYPGSPDDRRRREQYINRAITELERARQAFPAGRNRKEVELDLIALRLARRDEDQIREAAGEIDAFLATEAAKDASRARAVYYRGRAAMLLGDVDGAAGWFAKAVGEERPDEETERVARLALGVALREKANGSAPPARQRLLREAIESFETALRDAPWSRRWNQARIVLAATLIDFERPAAAAELLRQVVDEEPGLLQARYLYGMAELKRGRLAEAQVALYAASFPSNPGRRMRADAALEAARAALLQGDYGLSLALTHQVSAWLREQRDFSRLRNTEFAAMEALMQLGRMSSSLSLSDEFAPAPLRQASSPLGLEESRRAAAEGVAGAFGGVFAGSPALDAGYELGVKVQAFKEWTTSGKEALELALAMTRHLRSRKPGGAVENRLDSSEGFGYFCIALVRAEEILAADIPDLDAMQRVMSELALAADRYRAVASEGLSARASLEQGIVLLEGGRFLYRAAEKWEHGEWAGRSLEWREEARGRVEASLVPFDQALSGSGGAGTLSRQARWAKASAQEILGEWRDAANGFQWLMNDSEATRAMRVNAARHWALCLEKLGEGALAFDRFVIFAEGDAESALLAGDLAERLGLLADAFRLYNQAAEPGVFAIPPETPGRRQEAAYKAARIALEHPGALADGNGTERLRESSRRSLADAAQEDLGGRWVRPMLELLGGELIRDGQDGWRQAHRLAVQTAEHPAAPANLRRGMRMLAAEALRAGGNFQGALDELDTATELLGGRAGSRADAAAIVLATARVYREQGRLTDALRAFSDAFASYPDVEAVAEAARFEAAEMLLSNPQAPAEDAERAKAILSGLLDRNQAAELLKKYNVR